MAAQAARGGITHEYTEEDKGYGTTENGKVLSVQKNSKIDKYNWRELHSYPNNITPPKLQLTTGMDFGHRNIFSPAVGVDFLLAHDYSLLEKIDLLFKLNYLTKDINLAQGLNISAQLKYSPCDKEISFGAGINQRVDSSGFMGGLSTETPLEAEIDRPLF